jgi:dCMP deaminase
MPLDNLPDFHQSLLSGFPEDPEKREKRSHVLDEKRLVKWDKRYIELAAHVASWSKDPSAKVGCVIVSPTYGRALTFSFNGFPANVHDCDKILHHEDKTKKLDRIIHAEQNALLYAGREAKDCHAYIVGKPVCNTCAIMLVQAGIGRVVAAAPSPDGKGIWDEAGRTALALFKQAGVGFEPIDPGMNKKLIKKYDLRSKKTKETELDEMDEC